jgi:hypothetical protein
VGCACHLAAEARGLRPAKGVESPHPPADAQSKFAPFLLSVVHAVKHLWREEGIIPEVLGRVVQHLGVDENKLGPADAVRFHLLQFAKQLAFFHRDAEPPPADHGAKL